MRRESTEHRLDPLAKSKTMSSRARGALLLTGMLAPLAFLWGCSGVISGQSTQTPPPQTYSISGTVSPAAGGGGARVTLSGAANVTTTANSSGNFIFTGLANGTYTVTPSHAGYTFNPSSLSVTVSGANITTGLNFTATPLTFGISGTISPANGGRGAAVTLGRAAAATTTADSTGNYSFSGLPNGTYTVTPNRAGYSFSPSTQTATISGANVTGINFTATPQVGQTFSISGTISPTAGGSGATVTLSGATSASTIADGAGNYTFTGLQNGAYTVTPSRTGYTFNPSTQAATVSGANVTGLNFTATPLTFGISGAISPATGGSGAAVTLSGAASATTTADSSGNYSFSGLANGTYAVTPSKTGYTFNPVAQNVTVSGANVTAVNFTATATAQTFNISGTISPTAGGSGATVTLSGAASATTTTSSSGSYTFTGLANGIYTVTPSNTGYTFSPGSKNVTISGSNVTGVNFTATAQVAHSATLSWVASTSTVAGYNIYRSSVSGGPYTKMNSSLVTLLTFTDTTVLAGQTYFYVATSVNASNVESSYSNEISAVIPTP